MNRIDWKKPIELMNGELREHEVQDHAELVWISEGPHYGFFVDLQGCIGDVQVVRNRKEPEKQSRWVKVYSDGSFESSNIEGGSEYAKILVWRDENGKTQVEVCDD